MAVKSIIDVEINDEKFKQFTGLFNKYRDAVKAMPGDWANVGTELEKNQSTFEAILAAMLAQNQLAEKVTKTERSGEAATRATASHWKEMARSTKSVAGNIVRATESLLKWVGLTGVVSGLLGAGGLWGIDRMAASVTGGRRAAQGLGTSYGASKAFGINFGGVVDPGGFLAAVNRAQSDVTNSGFLGAGMTRGEMRGDSATVAVNLLSHLKRIADATPKDQLTNVMQYRHLDQFTSLEEMNRIKDMTGAEFNEYRSNYGKDRKNLDLDRDTQNGWMAFTQQMGRAGQEIENVFVKGLIPLAGPLKDLSATFVQIVKDLANDGTLKKWIEELGQGIEALAKHDFKNDIDKFKGWMRVAADDVEIVARKLHWLVGQFKTETTADYLDKYPEDAGKILFKPTALTAASLPRPGFFYDNLEDKAREIIKKSGLPTSLFHSMLGVESSGNPNAVSPRGAVGLMQLMGPAAEEVGVTNRRDPLQSLYGGGEYLKRQMKRFGDFDQALAAYNWGPDHVAGLQKEIEDAKKYNRDWRGNLPIPVQDYVKKVESGMSSSDLAVVRQLAIAMGRNNTTQVTVHNNTGGNAIVSVAQTVFAQ